MFKIQKILAAAAFLALAATGLQAQQPATPNQSPAQKVAANMEVIVANVDFQSVRAAAHFLLTGVPLVYVQQHDPGFIDRVIGNPTFGFPNADRGLWNEAVAAKAKLAPTALGRVTLLAEALESNHSPVQNRDVLETAYVQAVNTRVGQLLNDGDFEQATSLALSAVNYSPRTILPLLVSSPTTSPHSSS